MKKSVRLIISFMILTAVLGFMACGSHSNIKLTEKGKLLTSVSWKMDPSATLKETTDAIKDSSGITSDIKLEKDVKKLADFASETLTFGPDKKDPNKLSYKSQFGEGLLSISVTGYWNFSPDESSIIMREWDSQAGKEKEPITYKIVELTKDKLVLQREGSVGASIYFPKK
jgi:hypothetical protein